MLGRISLLAAVIVRYTNSYLDGDDRHGVFLGWLATTIAAVEVLVLAGNLGLLVVAWVATSASLHRLLVFYPDRRRAVVAAGKKFVAARVGDGFLVTAATLLYDRFGTGDLGAIEEVISRLPDQLRRSLTWDQGAEMGQHAQLRIDTGLDLFFCDPHSP